MPAPDYAVEIAALQAGLAGSELTIEANGQRVTFQSFRDMKARLDYFAGLAAAASAATAPQSSFGFSAVAFERD